MEKVYLFDGTPESLANWRHRDGSPARWTVEDGILHVGIGTDDIVSVEKFGDAHIHLEWQEPDMPTAKGQDKGNSGVYVHGCYELQVLDSYGIAEPALEWQTYDIYIRAPRFEDGKITSFASMTVFQNGVCIQNNIELYRNTPGSITPDPTADGPIILQDHDCPVSFRNVWFERL